MKIVPITKPCVIDTKAPYSVAKLFLDKFVTRVDARTLHHHRGAFYKWNGRAYLEKADGELRSEIYPFLDQSFAEDKKGALQPVKPNASMVTNVLDGLRAASHLDGSIAAPAWLRQVSQYPAEEIVACENGLLHLPSAKIIDNTPEFFTYNALDFAFDQEAPEPKQWLDFLLQLWPNDSQSISTLQEIFGYCLTGDTRQQKAFLIVGPRRSGKGTIARILGRLIGVANIVAPMFGGMPATGAIARTATNVKNGGRTPVAGMVHALTLLLITLFFGRWAALIPLATLAAILVVVSYHMSEWRTFRSELTAPKSDVAVLLTTFSLTVLVDLTVAIEVGMVLAAFLFMRRMAEVTNVSIVTRELADGENDEDDDPNSVRRREVPRGVEVFEISGPFFFGAAEQFKDTLGQIAKKPKVLIIRMRDVPAIDSTGLHALHELARRCTHDGTLLLLADVHAQPMFALVRSDLLVELGEENLFGNLDDALDHARQYLELPAVPHPAGALPTVARETPQGEMPKMA